MKKSTVSVHAFAKNSRHYGDIGFLRFLFRLSHEMRYCIKHLKPSATMWDSQTCGSPTIVGTSLCAPANERSAPYIQLCAKLYSICSGDSRIVHEQTSRTIPTAGVAHSLREAPPPYIVKRLYTSHDPSHSPHAPHRRLPK